LYNTYSLLNKAGYAQSVEVYENNKLTGGLFGININGAFFGESMYSISPNASKIALNFLIERLSKCHYTLFDTQFISKHLMSLGAIEITQESYLKLLDKAINKKVDYAFY
jgi:leucyl/phenylalanyl-tRNA--protein transferase